MDSFLYDDDIENDQKNTRKLATIEASLNRSLLQDGEKKESSCSNYIYLMYIVAFSLIVIVVIGVILVMKHLV